MNTITSTKTKVSTNTKLLVATAALAASIALAVIPALLSQDTYMTTLTDAGASKLNVIRVIKETTGLGLKESKDLVDNVPSVIKQDVSEAVANDIKKKIEAVGGKVTVQLYAPALDPVVVDVPLENTFIIQLTDAGASKLGVVKVIKETTGLSLKEAKDMVDAVPSIIKMNVPETEANDIKKKIEAVGGKVVLQARSASTPNSTPSSTVSLTVSPTALNLPSTAGSDNSVTVASNVSWSVSDDQTWLDVSPATGSNNGTLAISYTDNNAASNRTGVVTVVGGGITRIVSVTQTGTPASFLTVPSGVGIGAAQNSKISFNISSNINWTVSEDIAWLTVSPLTGSNNASVTFTASQANTTASSRVGSVTVSGPGVAPQTIMVTQAAASSTPTTTASLIVSPTSLSVGVPAGSSPLTLTSNQNWRVTDNQTWLSVSPVNGSNNGTLTVTYTANPTASNRTGVVTVVGGGITRTVAVTQAAPSSSVTAPSSTFLNATIDTNYTGLRNDHYVLAGTQKHLAGRVQLSASGEGVKLKHLALNVLSASSLAHVKNTFDSITIYKDAAMTMPLVTMSPSLGTVVFQYVNYGVPKDTTQYLYIGVQLKRMGTLFDNGTAVSNVSLNFGLKDAETAAEGATSFSDVLAQNVVVTENVFTKLTTSIGSQITNVATSFPGGNLAGGEQTFFTFAVTANSGVNTDNTGDALSAYLTRINLQLATDVAADKVSGIKLCRVSTGNCINLDKVAGMTETITLQTASDGYVDMTDFVNSDDERVDSGETVQYEVRATFLGVTDKYAQGSIQDVNNSGIVWGYDVDRNGAVDLTFTDLKKMEPRWSGYPDVTGAALN